MPSDPIIYVKPGCFWCEDALGWLKSRGIAHSVRDVFANPADFARMREISGQSKAPTLEMPDGSVLADFDVAQLEAFLNGRSGR